MSKIKHTRTATFLFPLLGVPKSLFSIEQVKYGRAVKECLFCNAYLSVVGHISREKGIIYILVRDARNPREGKDFLGLLTGYKNYRSHFKTEGFTILVFKILDRFINDYELILLGNYSGVSQSAKNMIFQHHFFSGKPHVLPLIMNKANALKVAWEERLDAQINNQEVWPIMQKTKETLSLSELQDKQKK